MGRAAAVMSVVAVLAAACSAGGDECGGEADCPHLVSHGGREYRVSCAVVPRRLVGDPLDVTDEQERKFGPGFAVDGFELEGVGPEEAIVLKFALKECGDEAYHVGFAEDLARQKLKALDRLLRE